MRAMPAAIAALLLMGLAVAASAQNTTPFAPGFSEHAVTIAGRPVHYRIGGKGPAVLLVHGYGDTGEMWRPLALMDAPIPGVGPWLQILPTPALWHFNFYGKYAEALVAGRERIYLDRILDAFAYHPERVTPAMRAYYATSYAQPGNMHAGFSYFQAFSTDAKQNIASAKTPLAMPVLAMGGVKSFGSLMPLFARAVATNVQVSVIPDAGHWLMEENPRATEAALVRFLTPRY
jgi:pimeloyl-ACP methyl ester carboxylesterase